MKWSLTRHRLLPGRSRREQSRPILTVSNEHFDESSGLVYSETSVPAQTAADRNWAWQLKPRSSYSYRRLTSTTAPVRGSRPLLDYAIESILENITDLTLEGLECLPTKMVAKIWSLANERFHVPFHTWAMFSKVLHKGEIPLSLLRFRQAIESPRLTLHAYTAALTSKSFDFLASLSITVPFTVSDLVRLSKVTNLGILEVVYTEGPSQTGISDRLIRTWAQAATEEGAFSVLRVLKLWNHNEVTSSSLKYLNSFPALAVYDVRGCGFVSEGKILAQKLGWTLALNIGILPLLEVACVKRAARMRSSLNIKAKPTRRPLAHQLEDNALVSRPPRTDVPSFLADAEWAIEQPGEISECQRYVDLQEYMRVHSPGFPAGEHVDWSAVFCDNYNNETWEFLNYTTFARIGELRNDSDLSRAGVKIGNQATVNSEIVNSVPLASVRLGPSRIPSIAHLSSRSPQDRLFIHTHVLSPDNPSDSASLPQTKEAEHGELKGSTKGVSAKRKLTGSLRSKKQKLDDVLNAFM